MYSWLSFHVPYLKFCNDGLFIGKKCKEPPYGYPYNLQYYTAMANWRVVAPYIIIGKRYPHKVLSAYDLAGIIGPYWMFQNSWVFLSLDSFFEYILDLFEPICKFFSLHEPAWNLLCPFVPFWTLFGPFWKLMDPFRPLDLYSGYQKIFD